MFFLAYPNSNNNGGYACLVIIAIVALIILMKYGIKELQRRRQIQRFYIAIEPIVTSCYNSLIGYLRTQYPSIEFSFPQYNEVLDKLNLVIESMDSLEPNKLNTSLAVRRSFDSFLSKVVEDYKSFEPELVPKGTIGHSDAPEDFWAAEEQNRITANGRNPKDWSTRRKLVYNRDGGRCIRCGGNIGLFSCHIHHIRRRSEGGDHSLNNLIALCRDCHKLMEEHEKMFAIFPYYISPRGTIHTSKCRFAKNMDESLRWGQLETFISRGYKPCSICNPLKIHSSAIERKKLEFESKIRKELVSAIHFATSEPTMYG